MDSVVPIVLMIAMVIAVMCAITDMNSHYDDPKWESIPQVCYTCGCTTGYLEKSKTEFYYYHPTMGGGFSAPNNDNCQAALDRKRNKMIESAIENGLPVIIGEK